MANKSLKKYFLVGTKSRLLNSLYETYLIQNEILKFGRNDLEIDEMIKLIKKVMKNLWKQTFFGAAGVLDQGQKILKLRKIWRI